MQKQVSCDQRMREIYKETEMHLRSLKEATASGAMSNLQKGIEAEIARIEKQDAT